MSRFALATLLMLPLSAFGGVDGYWKTIDDETGKVRSVVQITTSGDTATGRIVQLYRQPDEEADPKCTACKGAKKDKWTSDLVIMEDLKGSGKKWEDGSILDPSNGKVYSCHITESADGKTLEVRGYLGFSLLGRTQVWHRVPASQVDMKVRTFLMNGAGKSVPYVSRDHEMLLTDEAKAAHLGG
jgi:uncharacterized protein (DUF2147 family)